MLASLPRKFHQNHDDEEQGYEDYRQDASFAFRSGTDCLIFACRAGRGRLGKQAIKRQTRLNAAVSEVRTFGSGVPDADQLSAAIA